MTQSGNQFSTLNPSAGIARVLKPAVGFEAIFQGLPAVFGASVPDVIPFFEWPGGRPPTSLRAPAAGKTGFDPNLVAMLSVPFGAVLQLAIPAMVRQVEDLTVELIYRYTLTWRWSSTAAYQNQNAPRYSVGQQGLGAPNTLGPSAGPRFVLPAAVDSVQYLQTEVTAAGIYNVRGKQYDIVGPPGLAVRPLLATGQRGVLMQGVADPAVYPFASGAPYILPSPIYCPADEMLITAQRTGRGEGESLTWDFTDPTGTDFQFSNLFGTGNGAHEVYADAGIYLWPVSSGAGPGV